MSFFFVQVSRGREGLTEFYLSIIPRSRLLSFILLYVIGLGLELGLGLGSGWRQVAQITVWPRFKALFYNLELML